MQHNGDPIKGEVSSTDASSGIPATLYLAGSDTVYALLPTEIITVTDIIFVSAAGGAYAITAGADVAGQRIARGTANVNGGITHHFATPIELVKGQIPTLFAAAGQVDFEFSGFKTGNQSGV